MNAKRISLIVVILMILIVLSGVEAEILSNRTGDIIITTPDGKTIEVDRGEPLPDIPPGSTIELLNMGLNIAPEEGTLTLEIGPSVTVIKKGMKVTTSIDTEAAKASFGVIEGEINIILEHTTATVRKGQVGQIGMDLETGEIGVKSIFGTIETLTFCVKSAVPQGGIITFGVNNDTSTVNVSAKTGNINIKALDQESQTVAEGTSVEIECPEIGEIIPVIPEEEPRQPEIVEPGIEEEPVEPQQPDASPVVPSDS